MSSGSILQETNTVNSTSLSTLTCTFSNPTTQGASIHVCAISQYNQTFGSVPTDTAGNTYHLLDAPAEGSGQGGAHWAAYNCTANSANTVSVAMGFASTQHMIIIREVGGVKSSPLDGHNGTSQATPGTGSNAITVSATSSNQPNFASAIGYSYSLGIAVGTNVAWVGGQTNINGGGVLGGYATTEHLNFTSTGSTAATWTGSSAGAALSFIAIFDVATPTSKGLLLGNSGGF